MLETIKDEIVKFMEQENKRDMDLGERNVMVKAYSIFINQFVYPFTRSFSEIKGNCYVSEDCKRELCIKNVEKMKEFIKRFSEEFFTEDKE